MWLTLLVSFTWHCGILNFTVYIILIPVFHVCVCVSVCNSWDLGNEGTSSHHTSYTIMESFAWRVALTASQIDMKRGLREKAFKIFSQVMHETTPFTLQRCNTLVVFLKSVQLFSLQLGCREEEEHLHIAGTLLNKAWWKIWRWWKLLDRNICYLYKSSTCSWIIRKRIIVGTLTSIT